MPAALAVASSPMPEPLGLLRFITCGSVDDGKSTLIGRLLHDTGSVPHDQIATLANESRRFGTQGAALDLALLLDGLSAEREQGITIDVAYRYFHTPLRNFIVIDAPGHAQYTRNMVTGASQADCAVVLVDARHGLTDQTRRHARLLALLGVGSVVLAINRMDRVGFARDRYDAIVAEFAAFGDGIGLVDVPAIPLSALTGDNVVRRSSAAGWYRGPTLLETLEAVPLTGAADATRPLRLPVQLVMRPDEDFRGVAGTVAQGTLRAGDAVRVQPSGRSTHIARIVGFDGDRAEAGQGDAVVVTLADAIDCARGDIIVAVNAPLAEATAFDADLVWMSETPLDPDIDYLLKSATRSATARVAPTGPRLHDVGLNDIVRVRVTLSYAMPLARYQDERLIGGFVLIDRGDQSTVAAGMILVLGEAVQVRTKSRGYIIWVVAEDPVSLAAQADRCRATLREAGERVVVLDAATLHGGLCSDLTDEAAPEWQRRSGEAARLVAMTRTAVVLPVGQKPVELFGGRIFEPTAAAESDWVI